MVAYHQGSKHQREHMKLPRRKFLHLAAGAAALPATPHIAGGTSLSVAVGTDHGRISPGRCVVIVAWPMTPGEFGKLMAKDAEKWSEVIRTAGIKAE
jgi:hypothetical protein